MVAWLVLCIGISQLLIHLSTCQGLAGLCECTCHMFLCVIQGKDDRLDLTLSSTGNGYYKDDMLHLCTDVRTVHHCNLGRLGML